MTAPVLNNVASTPAKPQAGGPESPATLWQIAWRQVRRNRLAMICLGIIVFYTLVAAYAEGVYRYFQFKQQAPLYKAVDFDNRFAQPSPRHPLGTDCLGRDVFLQVVQGTRVAFTVGVFTSIIAIPIAVVLGALAGYFGNRVDDFIVWLYTVFDSIHGLPFIIAMVIVFRRALQQSQLVQVISRFLDPGLFSV